MTLVYNEGGNLIFAQILRHKYYVATDQCGTPMMIFNQYGEVVREIVRSPFGHIVYDSNPYLYLPIDFCGGLLDQVSKLIIFINYLPTNSIYENFLTFYHSRVSRSLLHLTAPNNGHVARTAHALRARCTCE